ncbi:MAG: CoA-disulfide reductase [Clostridiaceae bacterium]|nr:CoA-disulfide reductase [Clostridiaceae bacterium]
MRKKVLIVGGVAGGASAAARLRRLDEHAEIIIFEKDRYISYANCGLPYYIGEVIKDRDDLIVQSAEDMKIRFNIDVRTESEVTGINPGDRNVTVKNKSGDLYTENYDYLILSPGARAFKPAIPGINSDKVLSLRNISDTDAIKSLVDEKGMKSAVVIGGGFIGVEIAENLIQRGVAVTLVELAGQVLAQFDEDMAAILENELAKNGVNLMLNTSVTAVDEKGDGLELTLSTGEKISADFVVVGAGVIPDTDFLKGSGIELGLRGHIIVNEKMQTNIRDIYAVGDAIEVVDFVNGKKTAIPLAGPANKQGRIAADNIAGLNSVYKGSQGSSIIKVFNLTAACTGNNERTLKRLDMPYKAIYVHPMSHASYYPGATQMTVKLLFDDQGKVLGAQAIGHEGVDKRIDVIATVIRLNGTVNDMAELELSYAPPYSSAKDPVNVAGFVAQNCLNGISHLITWDDFEKLNREDYVLVDVRTRSEYRRGHIEGAINIPVDELRERLDELDREKTIVVYCQVGFRGYLADRILSQNGYNVLNITGGFRSELARRVKK